MNKFLILLFLTTTCFVYSQTPSVFYLNRTTQLDYFSIESCNTGDIIKLQEYLQSHYNCDLKLTHIAESPYTKTYSFSQTKNGIEVYHGFVKVIVDIHSNTFLVCHDIFNGIPELTNSKAGTIWFFYKNNWILASKEIIKNSESHVFDEIIKDENNNIISRNDLALRAGPKDTTIRVKVFNPDPLTSSHNQYAVPYVDYNDSDVAVLNAQRVWKNVVCTFNNDTFWLSNKYLAPFKYRTNSYDPVYRVKDTVFDYTRHQHQFEDVMVMYHVTTYQDYINTLGYSNIGFRPTPYDAHGDLSDNSGFLPGTGLVYGVGGIDDAEDAEVITHEYTHSLREFVSPDTYHGAQRMALEEGLCDYMSTAYKMNIDSFGWKKWAIWDGNNPQTGWFGRNVASQKMYPQALGIDTWKDGEVWSSALMRIYFKLGRTITDKLTLQTLYYLTDGLTMTQTALLFIKADTVLYGGIHTEVIWRTFAETHILPWYSGINNPIKVVSENIKLLNSAGFAEGKGNLIVYLPKYEKAEYTLTNNLGQIIINEKMEGDNFTLNSSIIKSNGILYLTVITATFTETKKIVLN